MCVGPNHKGPHCHRSCPLKIKSVAGRSADIKACGYPGMLALPNCAFNAESNVAYTRRGSLAGIENLLEATPIRRNDLRGTAGGWGKPMREAAGLINDVGGGRRIHPNVDNGYCNRDIDSFHETECDVGSVLVESKINLIHRLNAIPYKSATLL